MKLSVIIPAYNEERTIEEIIRRVKAVNLGNVEKEIVVVDDGSKDRTREILKSIPGIAYIFHEKNLGKGGAVRSGFKKATGDILVVQDADLEYDPEDFQYMIRPIVEGRADVVNGVRIQPSQKGRQLKSLYWLSWVGNFAITHLTNWLYWHDAEEYEGCYKAYRKRIVDGIPLRCSGFEIDNELVCKILKRKIRMLDVPIRYYPRNYSEGKKIRWKDGFIILWTIIKYRFAD